MIFAHVSQVLGMPGAAFIRCTRRRHSSAPRVTRVPNRRYLLLKSMIAEVIWKSTIIDIKFTMMFNEQKMI